MRVSGLVVAFSLAMWLLIRSVKVQPVPTTGPATLADHPTHTYRARTEALRAVLGSNIFNSLAVGAIVALVAPGTLEDGNLTNPTGLALWFMLAITIVAMAFMWSGENTLGRREGTVLLAAYLAVIPFLVSAAPDAQVVQTARFAEIRVLCYVGNDKSIRSLV